MGAPRAQDAKNEISRSALRQCDRGCLTRAPFSRSRVHNESDSEDVKESPLNRVTSANGTPCAALFLLLLLVSGCATAPQSPPSVARHFDFQKDTFSYPNELVWEYYFDAKGNW